jgi:rhodanese-related sulfurtransferase
MMGAKRHFTIVKRQHLANRLKAAQEDHLHLSFLVIDVREPENYAKGHIKHAINYDSRSLLNWTRMDAGLLDKLKSSDKEIHLYFHCHLSLIRGPSSAKHIEKLLGSDSVLGKKIKVFLVEGGWKGWKREYPDMIE